MLQPPSVTEAPALRMSPQQIDRKFAVVIFAALWATYALIGPGHTVLNPNTISRMGFVFSAVQDHTGVIDAFAPFTVDKALVNGHFAMDKAPGLALMAIPIVALANALTSLTGLSTAPIEGGKLTLFYILTTSLATILTSAPLTAAAAAACFRLARRLGASQTASCFGALTFGLCTPAFGWSTVFFGHAAAGACLFLGFAATIAASDPNIPPERDTRAAAIAGAWLGWATVVEFTVAAPVLIVALVGLARIHRLSAGRQRRIVAASVAAAIAAVIPLAVYNLLVFGSIAHLGYSDVVGFDQMQQGFFGISRPRPEIAIALLIGAKRGLVLVSPILALAPIAWFAARGRMQTPVLLGIIAIPLALLSINAGYAYWDGGASTGPRHLVPAMGFLALAFVPLFDRCGPAGRSLLIAAALVSLGMSVICATVSMESPFWMENPVTALLIPNFLAGDLHNILALAGNGGHAWLVLLVLPWLISGWAAGILRPRGRREALLTAG